MSPILKKLSAVAAGGVALCLTFAGIAGAIHVPPGATSTTTPGAKPAATSGVDPAAVKAKCVAAIQQRLATLDQLTSRVNSAKHLTAGNRATLLADIQSDRTGLTSLEGEINGETTLLQLKVSCPKIVNDYRVYLLLVPQVHMVVAADAGNAAIDDFNKATSLLQKAINAASTHGVDPAKVADAQARSADAQAKITDAKAKVDPVVAELVALTPADINNGSAQSVLASAKAALAAARDDLKLARADLAAAVQDLHKA